MRLWLIVLTRFVVANDLISKVRGRWTRTEKWVKETRHLLVSGKRMSLQDAKILLENGEKLQVNLPELHSLKSKLDLAQNWLKKVGNCTNGQGAKAKAVDQLIDEYDDLLVEFPEELEDLQQANVGYCLCRRPYEGFMIGCDHCEVSTIGACFSSLSSLLSPHHACAYRNGTTVLVLAYQNRKQNDMRSSCASAARLETFLRRVHLKQSD